MVQDRLFFFSPTDEHVKKEIAKLGTQSGVIAYWLRKSGGRVSVGVFRNQHADESDGFSEAYQRLSGILDGYAFLIEEATPEVWPVVLVRQRDEPDAQIKLFDHHGWVMWGSAGGETAQTWKSRRSQLLKRFLAFFDAVAGDDLKFNTEIANQLSLSAKMFRHGRTSAVYGIEFLCKFTALEGLVCGPKRDDHRKLLENRLSTLFRANTGLAASIKDLWRMRCEASHQGKAFSHEFAHMLELLERLNLGVMVFALDHITSLSTIDDLWNRAASYVLPVEATMERPAGTFRMPVVRGMSGIGKWADAGLFTDAAFIQISAEVRNDML